MDMHDAKLFLSQLPVAHITKPLSDSFQHCGTLIALRGKSFSITWAIPLCWRRKLDTGAYFAGRFNQRRDIGENSITGWIFNNFFIISSPNVLWLYFYPKDKTPGCTVEAQNFTQDYPKYQALNTKIVGVSYDDVESHKEFSDEYEMPFTLLADSHAGTLRQRFAAGSSTYRQIGQAIQLRADGSASLIWRVSAWRKIFENIMKPTAWSGAGWVSVPSE